MSRRGENIRKRKDGRWEGRYIKGRKTDKSAIWGYVYGRTYAAVKKELTARKMESHINTYQFDFCRTFSKVGKFHFFRGQSVYDCALPLYATALHFACAWQLSCKGTHRSNA